MPVPYNLPLFERLSPDELKWIADHSSERTLEAGEYLFHQGDDDPHFYIVLDGELQITQGINGVEQVLGNTARGGMSGEMALLQGAPRTGTARAIQPTRLLLFDQTAFRGIFAAVPQLAMEILRTASARLSGNASRLTHNEKLVALGKFSAGLAHEFNNPASAARRAARTFQDMMSALLARSVRLCTLELDRSLLDRLLEIERDIYQTHQEVQALTPLEQSDREDELTAWLDELGMNDAYASAPVFVSSGLDSNQLHALLSEFPDSASVGILEWLSAALNARSLLSEINDSTTRISDLVKAVKEYTYMDRDDVQEVDVHKSLDTTLKVLAHKLGNIKVAREYDPELPRITANGSELNQVWTNLIDNAIDAVKDRPDGQISLTTRCESDFIMVAVSDNGAGIPKHVLPRIFEPFYTTKGVGEGTGLGLDIVFRIVTQHEGTIDTESQPGNTRFTVRLPVEPRRQDKN